MSQPSANPFTERSRIVRSNRFAGRWGELSQVFDRIEAARPVLVTGAAGVGKSSLLTHVMQSAAATMDLPDLRSYYIDLDVLGGPAEFYRLVVQALGSRGESLSALDVALLERDAPLLLCLDNADQAIAEEWGARLLEDLARMVRAERVMLVVAVNGPPPLLSERFALLSLGAFAPSEVRLMTDAYLDGTNVSFSPGELRQLAGLSASHPGYLQRAAFHLFRSKVEPGVDWRTDYLSEARERPIPGAPLPPQVFEGAGEGRVADSVYGDEAEELPVAPATLPLPAVEPALLLAVPILISLVLLAAGSWALAAAVAGLGLVGVLALVRRS